MIRWLVIPAAVATVTAAFAADPPEDLEANRAKHRDGAAQIADSQDELSADVQQLTIEQTMGEVIKLLNEVESIMDEATDRLAKADTGGETIAAQTEVIEKIHAAAKAKQSQGGGSEAGGAMMDMLGRMMGEGDKSGQGKGGKPSDKGGQGSTGLSDTANEANGGSAGGKSEVRRIPKAAGSTPLAIPEEFRRAFDAYNRGAEKKIK